MKIFLWIRLVAFSYTFLFAVIVVNLWNLFFDKIESENILVKKEIQTISKKKFKDEGTAQSGNCFGEDDPRNEYLFLDKVDNTKSQSLQIKYKPIPKYTEEARNNNIQGKVRVRVTFLANGEIGSVSEVVGLPFGLTAKAIEAAKKMKFEPQKSNGVPIIVTKVVVYTFTIY